MSFCNDVAKIIVSYLPGYELLDWIDEKKLFLVNLSSSDTAIDLLLKYKDELNLVYFCLNPSPKVVPHLKENIDKLDKDCWERISRYTTDVSILEENPDKIVWSSLCWNSSQGALSLMKKDLKENKGKNIDWNGLSTHPGIMSILEDNMDDGGGDGRYKISWENLATNPAAISILEKEVKTYENHDWWWYSLCQNPAASNILRKYIHKIDWWCLSQNLGAIDILEENLDKVNWYHLSGNSAAGRILKKYPHKINWDRLCENSSPEAIELLKDNIENHGGDKIDWALLSENPGAIELLKANMDKIRWYEFSLNPAIFTPAKLSEIYKELISI